MNRLLLRFVKQIEKLNLSFPRGCVQIRLAWQEQVGFLLILIFMMIPSPCVISFLGSEIISVPCRALKPVSLSYAGHWNNTGKRQEITGPIVLAYLK